MSARVFIDGAAGTTGLEIIDRLAGRDDLSLVTLDDAARKDDRARADAANQSDIVILCLPDDAARDAVAAITNPAVRVIDASSAHRTAPGWVYGFAELQHDQATAIGTAARVTNPGCYPTGFLALVAPLVAAGMIAPDDPMICYAVSGFSGGGKALIARFDAEPDLAWRSYALGMTHKHQKEMQILAGLSHPPLFAPSVIPAFRGMQVDVPIIRPRADAATIHAHLAAHYADAPLVRVAPFMPVPDELTLRDGAAGHDGMTLYVLGGGDQLRLIAMLDNLGKGASGACVQNLNLMLGADAMTGLRPPG